MVSVNNDKSGLDLTSMSTSVRSPGSIRINVFVLGTNYGLSIFSILDGPYE